MRRVLLMGREGCGAGPVTQLPLSPQGPQDTESQPSPGDTESQPSPAAPPAWLPSPHAPLLQAPLSGQPAGPGA